MICPWAYKVHLNNINMFWMFFSFICGITFAQEFPDLPKIRPKIQQMIDHFKADDD